MKKQEGASVQFKLELFKKYVGSITKEFVRGKRWPRAFFKELKELVDFVAEKEKEKTNYEIGSLDGRRYSGLRGKSSEWVEGYEQCRKDALNLCAAEKALNKDV